MRRLQKLFPLEVALEKKTSYTLILFEVLTSIRHLLEQYQFYVYTTRVGDRWEDLLQNTNFAGAGGANAHRPDTNNIEILNYQTVRAPFQDPR